MRIQFSVFTFVYTDKLLISFISNTSIGISLIDELNSQLPLTVIL